jgi:putative transcriptional regulator
MRLRRLTQLSVLLFAGAGYLTAQSKRPEDLAVGKILVTPRNSPDPLFAESVILLVHYGEGGALGLMVNRRTTVPISRALREFPGASARTDPVFVGGPVELDTVFALARAPHSPEGAAGVLGDVYFITARGALEKALGGTTSPTGLRVYLGYCGWGPRQLNNEMRRGGWYIFDRSEDLAFDAEPSKLWTKLVAKAEDVMVRLEFVGPRGLMAR